MLNKTKLLCASLTAALALATSTANAAGVGGVRTLTDVDFTNNGLVIITADANFENPDNCGGSNVVVIKADNPAARSLQAVALTAIASGAKVRPFLIDCDDFGFGNFPVVANLSVQTN